MSNKSTSFDSLIKNSKKIRQRSISNYKSFDKIYNELSEIDTNDEGISIIRNEDTSIEDTVQEIEQKIPIKVKKIKKPSYFKLYSSKINKYKTILLTIGAVIVFGIIVYILYKYVFNESNRIDGNVLTIGTQEQTANTISDKNIEQKIDIENT